MAAPIILSATSRHTASVIFLHGLGDTGHGWSEMFAAIKEPYIKYIFPTAPIQAVTLNAGMQMPSWFDIFGLGPGSPEDEAGIKKSSEALNVLITEEERSGISAQRIMLGGFSQGGVVSLYTALTGNRPLAGLLCLSTWMPLNQTIAQRATCPRTIPVLQCHGSADPLVPALWGRASHQILKGILPTNIFHELLGMGHSSCPEEVVIVKAFISQHLHAQ